MNVISTIVEYKGTPIKIEGGKVLLDLLEQLFIGKTHPIGDGKKYQLFI